jgi:hypothetical protein
MFDSIRVNLVVAAGFSLRLSMSNANQSVSSSRALFIDESQSKACGYHKQLANNK